MTDTNGQTRRDALRVLRPAADTGGELLELEASYAPRSPRPPEHYHPHQHERFEILQGEFRAQIGGELHTYRAGDRFEIPAGVPHWMHNAGDEPGRLLWQVRPALRTQQLLEAFFGGSFDSGPGKARRFLRLCVLLREHRAEFRLTRPPAPVQWILLYVVAPVARWFGVKAA